MIPQAVLVRLGSTSFKLPIEACVLKNSPNVLSVRKFCDEGWSELERTPNSDPDIAGWFDDSPQSEMFRSIFRRMWQTPDFTSRQSPFQEQT